MGIAEKITVYLTEDMFTMELDFIKKLKFRDTDELVEILNKNMNESRKSQFVAKLIGLGIITKDENGKFIKVKTMSKEDVINMLQHS